MASDNETIIALIALVTSLIAILITASQLLAQTFATAEGTRKCSRAVIGHWTILTSWKWHWSEWRFETLYVSPEIRLGAPLSLSMDSKTTLSSLVGYSFPDQESGIKTLIGVDDLLLKDFIEQSNLDDRDLLDGWIALLSTLRDMACNYPIESLNSFQLAEGPSWPGIRLRRRSWDTMPQDVFRPVASTTLGDIAIIARRMGMVWKVFEPERGKLLAEGRSHSLSAIDIRGLGLVLRYDRLETISADKSKKWPLGIDSTRSSEECEDPNYHASIWIRSADMFLFGIFPGNEDLSLPNFITQTNDDVLDIFNTSLQLKDSVNWKQTFGDKFSRSWFGRYEVNEIMSLVTPVFRQRGSIYTSIIYPGYGASIFTFQTAWNMHSVLLRRRLQQRSSHYLEGLSRSIGSLLERKKHLSFHDKDRMACLDSFHDAYDESTQYFQCIMKQNPNFYFDLLRAHMVASPIVSIESRVKCKGKDAKKPRDDEYNADGHRWRSEQMNMLWDNLPNLVGFMRDRGYKDEEMVEEAWITLFLRGLCWSTLSPQNMTNKEGDFLPSKYYGSQLPVFLT